MDDSAAIIVRDAAGEYYAIPAPALAPFRVPAAAVEAFLKGENSIDLRPGWTFRTSRRSNDLWLLFG